MENIQEPNKDFIFENLTLTPPFKSSEGHNFIKYIIKTKSSAILSKSEIPLYIQTPKCSIKQKIIKTKKNMFCDLIFTIENTEFLQWIENLESFSQTKLFENRQNWFETQLEKSDIENSFSSSLKIYKSGKNYILRVNISNVLGTPHLKIFNENRELVDLENITEEDRIISILEFRGIKCSPRGFQIEIEAKQFLVLSPVNIFDNCILLGTNNYSERLHNNIEENNIETSHGTTMNEELENDSLDNLETPSEPESEHIQEDQIETILEEPIEIIDIQEETLEDNDIIPIELSLDDKNQDEEPMIIRKRNDVYYEMYREALRKARTAKDLALSSFLEANRIKNVYMLEDESEENDSFFDEE